MDWLQILASGRLADTDDDLDREPTREGVPLALWRALAPTDDED